LGAEVTKSTVKSSILFTSFTEATSVASSEPSFVTRAKEKTTSSAVKGAPSWNLTPCRK
jgi:hypothetical protein